MDIAKNKSQIALNELFFLWSITHLPFLGSFLLKLSLGQCTGTANEDEASPFIIWRCIYSTMNNGEIFIYATSILGSIALVMHKYNEQEKKYPGHLKTLLIMIVALFISALFYSLYQTKNVFDKGVADVVACLMYFTVLYLWYQSIIHSDRLNETAIKNVSDDVQAEFDKQNKPSAGLDSFDGENPA